MKTIILFAIIAIGLNSCQKDENETIYCFSNEMIFEKGTIYIDQVLGKSCTANYAYSIAIHDENDSITRAFMTSDIKYRTRKDEITSIDITKHEVIYLNEF